MHQDHKFAYRCKLTNDWVHIIYIEPDNVNLRLMKEFSPDYLYAARNIIEEDLIAKLRYDDTFGTVFEDYELVQIKIEYSLVP